jgi:hypothetical protein
MAKAHLKAFKEYGVLYKMTVDTVTSACEKWFQENSHKYKIIQATPTHTMEGSRHCYTITVLYEE